MSSRSFRRLTLLVAAIGGCATSTTYTNDSSNPADGWPTYGRDPGGARYSPLNEINKSNVTGLHVVWTYRTGDISDGSKYPLSLRPASTGAWEQRSVITSSLSH